MTKWMTTVVVLAVTGALVIYDIAILVEPTPGDTISEILGSTAWRHPVIAWGWGALGGHLFWHMTSPISHKWVRLSILILVTSSLLVAGVAAILPMINPGLPLVLGIPAGRLGWPQRKR